MIERGSRGQKGNARTRASLQAGYINGSQALHPAVTASRLLGFYNMFECSMSAGAHTEFVELISAPGALLARSASAAEPRKRGGGAVDRGLRAARRRARRHILRHHWSRDWDCGVRTRLTGASGLFGGRLWRLGSSRGGRDIFLHLVERGQGKSDNKVKRVVVPFRQTKRLFISQRGVSDFSFAALPSLVVAFRAAAAI